MPLRFVLRPFPLGSWSPLKGGTTYYCQGGRSLCLCVPQIGPVTLPSIQTMRFPDVSVRLPLGSTTGTWTSLQGAQRSRAGGRVWYSEYVPPRGSWGFQRKTRPLHCTPQRCLGVPKPGCLRALNESGVSGHFKTAPWSHWDARVPSMAGSWALMRIEACLNNLPQQNTRTTEGIAGSGPSRQACSECCTATT